MEQNGDEVTELSTHLYAQLVAVHPAYDEAFAGSGTDQAANRCMLGL